MTRLANSLYMMVTTVCIAGLVATAPLGLGLRTAAQSEREQTSIPVEELAHQSVLDSTRNSVELYRRQCCRGSKILPARIATSAMRSIAVATPTCATQCDIYSLPLRC